jgi:hypothetical protein
MPRCADPGCARWRPAILPRWLGGLRLNDRWYCSSRCAESAVARGLSSATTQESATSLPPSRLGALLVHQRAITTAQLDEALQAQRQSGLRLGAQLRQMGVLSADALVRVLAAQAGISYLTTVDLARVRRGPGGLPENTVRALGLVPFDVDEPRRRLHVICTAPVPRAALRALTRLTDWTPEPYLVDDLLWERALAAYRLPALSAPHGAPASLTVAGVRAASAHVASAARARGAVTVRHADTRDCVWVRLESQAHVEDLMVTHEEGDRCLAEPIAR